MEETGESTIHNQIRTLREGIKNKYRSYHSLDRDRFPEFEYNTNRANYEPLRESFEEEFYVVRGIDRAQNSVHIPSTNTLALLFTDDSYLPGRKILNTCRSYAEGKSKVSLDSVLPDQTQIQPPVTKKARRLFVAILTGLLCLGILIPFGLYVYKPTASELIIERPLANSTVPQELIAQGNVSNAETVWIVVRYKKGVRYWVQPPIKVQDDGWWIGAIFIGGAGREDIGLTYQIRAFVNPVNKLKTGEVLYSWPEAELSTAIVDVVRGPADK